MDTTWFLKQRTKFIRFFYAECSETFRIRQKKIEGNEPPFSEPRYDESDEPPFLDDWIESDTALDIVGATCLSLASDSLKLYFEALRQRVIGFDFDDDEKPLLKSGGFLAAHKAALGTILQTNWTDCPVDFTIIEQVVLVRNRAQHGSSLTTLRLAHDEKTLTKFPRPFFLSEDEFRIYGGSDHVTNYLLPLPIKVTRANLFAALTQMDQLADWIDSRENEIWEWRKKHSLPRN